MKRKWAIRIVLASPGDVQPERDALSDAISNMNQLLRAADIPAVLEVARYETDVPPGIHEAGPQALIDSRLRIEQSDILIGIFWSRFGTPVYDSHSGTQHEIRQAIEAWRSRGSPKVMIYFCATPFQPDTPEKTEQYKAVQQYRNELIGTQILHLGKWNHEQGPLTFGADVATDLWDVILELLRNTPDVATPFLRFSLSVEPARLRSEGITELLPDLFLRCTYESSSPAAQPLWFSVIIFVTTQVTSRLWRNDRWREPIGEAILLEVGRPGASGYHLSTGISGNQIVFGRITLDELQPNETRIFQVSNVRLNASGVRGSAQLALSVSGAIVENGTPVVAEVVPGMKFELRSVDGSEWNGPHKLSPATGLILAKIANFRFEEGFAGAFKTRAPTVKVGSGQNYAASGSSESHTFAALLETLDALDHAGVADSGTKLKVLLHCVPKGVKLFASASDTSNSFGLKAKMVNAESTVFSEETLIDGVSVYEVQILEGEGWGHPSATLTWEVVHARAVGRRDEPGFLDFTLYASSAPDPQPAAISFGTVIVNGCLAPSSTITSSTLAAPIPRFLDTSSAMNLLTVEP